MKSAQKTRAIVLRSLDYGESDRILTFVTDEFGKLKGIAKGARRSKRRFANALEPFSLSTILFSRGGRGGLALIEGSDVINHFAGIRDDLDRTLVAAYVAELADHFSMEGKRNLPLFDLLTDYLGFIESGQMTETAERFFELRLLKSSGFEPVLDRCVTCGTPLETIGSPLFDCHEGGIRCARCTVNRPDLIPVSVGTLKTLLLGRDIDFAKMPRVGLSGPMARESREILGCFVRHLIGREIKSLNVLGEVRKRYT
ncbi:MAG TPA: DNA repair protein RecO [Syntrophales bacterium]|nr:DNA repair protein RecO [Syntrophales bacterium]